MIHDASFVEARRSRDDVASSIAASESPPGAVVSSITGSASEQHELEPVGDLLLHETKDRSIKDIQLVLNL